MIEELRMLRADDVANAILFMLSQPENCDVVTLQLRPHLQMI
jgi:NADP-dependent 3-hydroxy acid dehydrogenase YdfG